MLTALLDMDPWMVEGAARAGWLEDVRAMLPFFL